MRIKDKIRDKLSLNIDTNKIIKAQGQYKEQIVLEKLFWTKNNKEIINRK